MLGSHLILRHIVVCTMFAFKFQHQQFLKCTVAEPISTRSSNELSGTLYAILIGSA